MCKEINNLYWFVLFVFPFLKRVPSQVCAHHSAAGLIRGQRVVIAVWDPTHCNDRVLRNDITLHYGIVPPIPRYDVESVRAS